MLSIKTGFEAKREGLAGKMVCGLLSVLGKELHFFVLRCNREAGHLDYRSAAGVTAIGLEQITFWSNL
jgi:hypothetical protein